MTKLKCWLYGPGEHLAWIVEPMSLWQVLAVSTPPISTWYRWRAKYKAKKDKDFELIPWTYYHEDMSHWRQM